MNLVTLVLLAFRNERSSVIKDTLEQIEEANYRVLFSMVFYLYLHQRLPLSFRSVVNGAALPALWRLSFKWFHPKTSNGLFSGFERYFRPLSHVVCSIACETVIGQLLIPCVVGVFLLLGPSWKPSCSVSAGITYFDCHKG